MRIAVVVNSFLPPSEGFILDPILGWIDRGHSVDIYSPLPPEPACWFPEIQRYRLDQRVRVFPKPPSNKFLCRLTTAAQTVARGMIRPWVTWRAFRTEVSRPGGFLYPRFLATLCLLRKKYDLVLCHYGPNGNLALGAKLADPNIRFATYFHGYDYQMAVGEQRDMYRDLFQWADLLLANSPSTRDKIVELGADSEIIHVHPMGIDPARFSSPARSPKSPGDPLRILTVARYVPKKGLDYGIRAVQKVQARYPDRRITCDIIGYGPEQDNLQRLIDKLGLANRVSLLGPRPNEEVVARMAHADLFLLPSILEPLGVVLLEAQAAGLPIVATQTDGIPFAVNPERSAVLVPPGDADSLAEALCRLIDHPETWAPMGQAGRAHVETNFDIHRLNDTLTTLLEDLVNGKIPRKSVSGVNPAAKRADNTQ